MADDANTDRFSAARAIAIGSLLILIGAFWVVVQELLLNAGSLSSDTPPVGAVGLFLAVLTVGVLLQFVRRHWGLGRRELLLIWCMLVTFLPLASQGLWQRFVGIILTVGSFDQYPADVPDHMLPRGPELLRNGGFGDGLAHWTGAAAVATLDVGGAPRPVARLAGDDDADVCEMVQRLARRGADGIDRFAPKMKFELRVRARRAQFGSGAWFSVDIGADGRRWRTMLSSTRDSPAATVDGTGLQLMGHRAVEIPYGVGDDLWLRLRLAGRGRVDVARVSLRSNEPVFGLIEGSAEIDAGQRDRIPRDETARLHYRPPGALTPARWLYDLRGFVPWRAWTAPLLSWGLLWVAMFLAMYALGAILFRQWSDREKLTFPLTTIPLMLTEPGAHAGRYLPRLVSSRALWAGTITALLVYGLNGLNFYDSDVPALALNVDLGPLFSRPPWRAVLADGNPFTLRIVLLAVGVAFFMDLQLAFSLWFFYLGCRLWLVVLYLQGRLDIAAWAGGPGYGRAAWQFQGIGAAAGIVLVAIWLARRHLADVVRKAVTGSDAIDDRDDPLPHRAAVLLLLIALILLGIWGSLSGAGWWFGVLGMAVMLMFATMAARVRAQCPAPGIGLVPGAPLLLMMALGGLVSFGVLPMTYFLIAGSFMCAGSFLLMMPALMEGFQIASVARIPRGALGAACAVGFVVAVLAGGYVLLNWGYARGLSTMRGTVSERDDFSSLIWRWRAENNSGYNPRLRRFELRAADAAGHPLDADQRRQLAELEALPSVGPSVRVAGYSAAFTCLLAWVRLTFLRFPLHPLGYALATTPLLAQLWFSILLAWLIRLAGVRLGGVRLLRSRMQPYMIGLILGSVGAVLVWDVVAIYKVAHGYTGQVYVPW